MKFGAFLRLGRITALLVFAILLCGLGLCGSAAQPLPLGAIAAPGLAAPPSKPLGMYQPASFPIRRGTPGQVQAWKQQLAAYRQTPAGRSGNAALAPSPPQVAPQYLDLTTVPRPPFVGDSSKCFEKQPFWSWDQQFVYFASNHPGNAANYGTLTPAVGARFHIYRITSDGAFVTQITGLTTAESNGEQTFPSLNFAATKLAYVHRDTTGQQQLWVLDFFTNTATLLTGPSSNALNNPLNQQLRNVEHPSWSPNDNNITFSAVNVNANARNIYTVNVATKFVTQVTNGTPANGVNCKDPVYDPGNQATPQIVFAANATGVDPTALPANTPSHTPLHDLRGDGSADDVDNNLFRTSENRITPPLATVQLTSQIADDIEPSFNHSAAQGGFFDEYLAWSSLGRTANGLTGTTYDIFFGLYPTGTGTNETSGGNTATPVRVFTVDTNGGSVPLNQTDERYPTWSSSFPPLIPINRLVYSSNRTQAVVNNTATIGVGNVATDSDLWTAEAIDITPPTLFFYDPQNFPGEVLHIANQPLPNPGSRIGQPGDRFYFYARVLDGQYGVESVWVQIKDPDGPTTDASGVNHRLYGVGQFPGPNTVGNNVFVARRDGNDVATHWLHVPFETDSQGISASDYSYYIDGRPAAANYPTRIDDGTLVGTRARFASKNPGVDDFPAWSGNQNSAFNPIATSNRPPLDNQAIPQNRWLRLHDDGLNGDAVAGDNVYTAYWDTPLTPSDFYVDLIAYDKAFNPQDPTQQQNWIIYDNVHGFSTQAFTSVNPVLYVDDYGCGQKWTQGLAGAFRAFPEFRYGHESDVIDRPANLHPAAWERTTQDLQNIADPAEGGPLANSMLDFLTNAYGSIGWARGTLANYNYDFWRILAKGPLPETILNDYVPTRDEQPRRQADGSFISVQQPVPRRAVVWNSPYTGDIMAGGGTILDQDTQAKLTTYRNRSGRLVVAGGDILWALNLGITGGVFNTFAHDILGAQTFNNDASNFRQNVSGTALAQAITRDVVDDHFRPGFPGPPFWDGEYPPVVMGLNRFWSDFRPPHSGAGAGNPDKLTTVDAIPFQVNDDFTPTGAAQSIFDNRMCAISDANTQSKTVFLAGSLGSFGRHLTAAGDDGSGALPPPTTRQPLLSMNYRAKISHAMFCWMFSVDLTGIVVDHDKGGAPIGGAYVQATAGGQVVGAAFTNASGVYQMRGLPVGGWNLQVSSPGFVTFNKTISNGGHGLDLALTDFQMAEAPTGSISGTVLDQFGQAVPGVQIQAVLQAGPLYTGERNFFGTTGPDGTYLINNVPAGDPTVPAAYVVSVSQLPPLFQNAAPASQNANVITAQNTPNINFTVEGQPGPLTVGVFQSNNGAKGAPIPGAEVALLDNTNQLLPTGTSGVQPNNPLNTDANGLAVFSQVPAGPVTVSAFKSGFQEGIAVVPIPQQNLIEILLTPATIRPLYGLVTRAGTNNQPLQAEDLDTPVQINLLRKLSGQPLGNAIVFFPPLPVPGGNGAQYNVLFPNAQDGDYIVSFDDPSHPRFQAGAQVPVTITSSTPNIAPNLALQGKPGIAKGVVKSTAMGNPPIEGVTVTFTPSGGGAPVSVLTNASGQYQTATLATGLYNVTVNKFGYTPPGAPISVFIAGDRTLADILMTPSPRGEVYGLVTLLTNGALRDVIVRFTPQGAPGVFFDARSSLSSTAAPDAGQENYTTSLNTTDQTNAPAVNLPAATYAISVMGLNGQPDPRFAGFTVTGGASVTVAGGDQQRKNITLNPAAGTITGTVKDANTQAPVANAVVSVRNASNQVVGSVQTNANGQFTTGQLPGGAYTLVITQINYLDGTFPELVEGNITATPNPLLLTPKPPSTVSGTVRSKVDNALIGGVTIQLFKTDGTPVSPAVSTTSSDTLSNNPTRNYSLFPVSPGNYILKATKSGWKPAQQNITVLPGIDLTGINFLLDPEHVFGSGLLLISLPDTYAEDAVGLLNLDTGASPPERTAYWVTDQNRYAIYPSETEAQFFTPGKGMFVRLNSPRAFFKSGTPVANAPFSLAVKTGWNLIGTPRRVRVDWLKVKVQTNNGTISMQEAMNQGIIQNGLFGYVDGYFRSDFLDPFRGYFMRAFQNCTLIIPVDNTSASITPADRVKMAALPAPSVAQVAAELYAAGLGPAPRAGALPTLGLPYRLPQPGAPSPLTDLFLNRPWKARAG